MVVTVRNVLLITGDDLGIDRSEDFAWDAIPEEDKVATPHLRRLYQGGVTFVNARAYSWCSTTRVARETSRWAFRTGVGHLVGSGRQDMLLDEVTLARVVRLASGGEVATGFFGKFHLGVDTTQYPLTPLLMGYDTWSGTRNNLDPLLVGDYYQSVWESPAGGERRAGYVPDATTSDTLSWIRGKCLEGRRWFANVNYSLPHFPYMRPPDEQYDSEKYPLTSRLGTGDLRVYWQAGIQSLDYQVGQLLAGIPQDELAETLVIFTSDNGTPSQVLPDVLVPGFSGGVYTLGTPSHGKGTVYDIGTRVPLIMWGAGVEFPGRETSNVFSTVDLMPTIVEALGLDITTVPGKGVRDGLSGWLKVTDQSSSTPPRTYGLLEVFLPGGANASASSPGERAVYSESYKLIRKVTGVAFPDATDEFYDLGVDEYERVNLVPGGSTAGLTAGQLSEYNKMVAWYTTTLATP